MALIPGRRHKNLNSRLFVAAISSLLTFAGPIAIGAVPGAGGGSTTSVPLTEEPMHLVRHRSDRFLIYTNRIHPGEWTLYHRHRNDLLAVIAGDASVVNQIADGEPIEQKAPAGTVVLFPYADKSAPYVHRISVTGRAPFINVGLEFISPLLLAGKRSAMPVYSGAGVRLIAENRRGRAYRIDLPAKQSLALPKKTTADINPGSAVLIVALGTGTISFTGETEVSHWEAGQGDFRFHESVWPEQISNVSAADFSFVLFHAY